MAAQPISEPTDADIGAHCPHCEYNLTGLAESRCPECGNAFDLELILRRHSNRVCPATPWDESHHPPMLTRFVRTWKLAAFHPKQLARNFPARHDAGLATGYSVASFGFAVAIVTFGSMVTAAIVRPEQSATMIVFTFLSSLAACVACWVCESITALSLGLMSPHLKPLRTYHFWRGLTHYTSGFTLLTALWGAVLLFPAIVYSETRQTQMERIYFVAMWLGAIVIFFWWAATLCRVIVSRQPMGLRCVTACVVSTLLGVGAIYLGILISIALCAFCYDIMN